MFLALFLIGLFGFVLMTAMGFLHTGGHLSHTPSGGGHTFGHVAGHAAIGHANAGRQSIGQSASHGTSPNHAAHQSADQSAHQSAKGSGFKSDRAASIFLLLSPVTFFSLLMGAGATGLLVQHSLFGPSLIAAVAVGALAFGFGIVRPLMNALASFASRPSEGLEGMVAQNATASTRFDQDGRGLVTLNLDGQLVQILATLESDELQRGVQVAKGDKVTIVEVDKMKNTCRVTRELYV